MIIIIRKKAIYSYIEKTIDCAKNLQKKKLFLDLKWKNFNPLYIIFYRYVYLYIYLYIYTEINKMHAKAM